MNKFRMEGTQTVLLVGFHLIARLGMLAGAVTITYVVYTFVTDIWHMLGPINDVLGGH